MTIRDYRIRVDLPKLGSWPKSVHVFKETDLYALKAAEAADRPLLIRGEPGTGKSQLARAAAVATDRLFVSVVVSARAECQDLQWRFDAVGRLGEAQMLAHATGYNIRKRLVRTSGENIPKRMDPLRFLSPGPLWWVFDWASADSQFKSCKSPLEQPPVKPDGWQPKDGSVLLIDEIDKADSDLPNGLLETLGNGDFSVPYLGKSVRQSEGGSPLVIITTNEERELPAAFVRRCLVLHLNLPEDEKELLDLLCERGKVHFGERCTDKVRREAANLLLEDRKNAADQGSPVPGQAEYLDILRALCNMKKNDEQGQLKLLDKISDFALKKTPSQSG